MELLAAGRGFSSSEELAATFARVTGEDPGEIHLMLGIMASRIRRRVTLAMSGVQAGCSEEGSGPGTCSDPPSAVRSEASSSSNSQSPSDRPVCRPCLYPRTSGLAPNSDVNAKHEETRRLCHREGDVSFVDIDVPGRLSPFGPAAGFSSLDDLTPVMLWQLHDSSHGLLPSAYLRLTVVLPAVMAASCSTTVVADDTGQRIRMAVYNTGAASLADAQALLPTGARFALKSPFLKRCADGWLGLWVDIPSTLAPLDLLPLPPGQTLLVLGDGDFSFSASLSNSSSRGEGATITATLP